MNRGTLSSPGLISIVSTISISFPRTFDAEFFLRFKWKRPADLVLNENTIFF